MSNLKREGNLDGKAEDNRKRLWIAIELENIKRHDKPVKPKRFVPVGYNTSKSK